MNKQISAFTLVELIVVVTILAILATIGFVSYSWYLSGVRDTNRVASLTSISDGLELYRTKNDLPVPDNSIEIQIDGEVIGKQWFAGTNVLQTIEYSKWWKDPKDDIHFSYYLTDDKKHYQMMTLLEESDNLDTAFLNSTFAATDYSNRSPKVYGKRLWILTDADNTPVQDIISLKTAGFLDINDVNTQTYIARFTDNDILTASGITLAAIHPESSCKRIKEVRWGASNGIYSINFLWNSYKKYCPMDLLPYLELFMSWDLGIPFDDMRNYPNMSLNNFVVQTQLGASWKSLYALRDISWGTITSNTESYIGIEKNNKQFTQTTQCEWGKSSATSAPILGLTPVYNRGTTKAFRIWNRVTNTWIRNTSWFVWSYQYGPNMVTYDLSSSISWDTWNHYCTSFDGAIFKTYINGELFDTRPTSAANLNQTFTYKDISILYSDNSNTTQITAIDESMIFSIALSRLQIKQLYLWNK